MNINVKDKRRHEIGYCEIHIVDHCNMKCQGCGHFSTISPIKKLGIDCFERDIKRLSELIDVSKLNLMGGEPLLHEGINDFFYIARKYFKDSRIQLTTNGTLLKAKKDDFWESTLKHNIKIRVSSYPLNLSQKKAESDTKWTIKDGDIDYWREKYGTDITIDKNRAFFALINKNGDSNPRKAMDACRKLFKCLNLYDGKLFICPMTAYVHYYNTNFELDIPTFPKPNTGWINIHDKNITDLDILKHIVTPCKTCKFCTEDPTHYKWKLNKDPELGDWIS